MARPFSYDSNVCQADSTEGLALESCSALYKAAGISTNFNETIAHAVHSMIRGGTASVQRQSYRQQQDPHRQPGPQCRRECAPYAPDYPTGQDFSTKTMNIIDRILTHIGNAKDGLGDNWSPIERVVHTFHMWDLWNQVHRIYTEETTANPPSDQLCDCLMNTRPNGIYQAVKWVSDHYDSGTPITLLNRPIPKLADAASWNIWKYRLLYYYEDAALHDAAKFLYCAVKDF